MTQEESINRKRYQKVLIPEKSGRRAAFFMLSDQMRILFPLE